MTRLVSKFPVSQRDILHFARQQFSRRDWILLGVFSLVLFGKLTLQLTIMRMISDPLWIVGLANLFLWIGLQLGVCLFATIVSRRYPQWGIRTLGPMIVVGMILWTSYSTRVLSNAVVALSTASNPNASHDDFQFAAFTNVDGCRREVNERLLTNASFPRDLRDRLIGKADDHQK